MSSRLDMLLLSRRWKENGFSDEQAEAMVEAMTKDDAQLATLRLQSEVLLLHAQTEKAVAEERLLQAERRLKITRNMTWDKILLTAAGIVVVILGIALGQYWFGSLKGNLLAMIVFVAAYAGFSGLFLFKVR